MSKIIKPFGRRAVTIQLVMDDKGQGQLTGSRSVMLNGQFRDVALNIVEVCAILSQTVGATLMTMLQGAPKPGNSGAILNMEPGERTDGETNDNPNS